MRLLACIVIGVTAGMLLKGRPAFQAARSHDFVTASRLARWSVLAAFLCTCLSTTLLFRWPWRPQESSVAVEVVDTVVETVEEVVEVPKWIFFKTTKVETHDVPTQVERTEYRPVTNLVFSPLMLIPMATMGLVGAFAQLLSLRLVWRWFG